MEVCLDPLHQSRERDGMEECQQLGTCRKSLGKGGEGEVLKGKEGGGGILLLLNLI